MSMPLIEEDMLIPLIDMSIELELEDCAATRPTKVRRLRSFIIAIVLITVC
jgi:hypothetical protein